MDMRQTDAKQSLPAGEIPPDIYLVEYRTRDGEGRWVTLIEELRTSPVHKKCRKYGEVAFILAHKGQYPLEIIDIRFQES